MSAEDEAARPPSTPPASPKGAKGSVALVLAFVLGVFALGTAAAALLVESSATMVVLAAAACVAFASLVAAFVSLRGGRFGPSLAAIVASLCILAGIGIGFGVVSFGRFFDAVQRQAEAAREVVDEIYGFRLAPPTGSVFYGPLEVRELHERALAGAVLDDGVTVLVLVEPSYGLPLAEAALADLHAAFGEEVTWESAAEPTRFVERDAVRIHRQIDASDGATFSESTYVERDGWLYHVHAFAEGPAAPEGEVWYPGALDGFGLLDVEVEPPHHAPLVAHDEGPGFTVEDGVYESHAWGVRVLRPDDRWRLTYGPRAPGADQGAIVGLEGRRPDVALSLTPLAVGGRDPEEVERELLDGLGLIATPRDDPPIVLEVSGEPVSFSAWSWASGRTYHARAGLLRRDDRVFEILAWSPTRALTDAHLEDLVRRVVVLDPDALAAARADARPAPWRGLGQDWWVSGETLRFVDLPIAWRRPDARWVAIANEERPEDEGIRELATIAAPTLGLRGRLVSFESDSDAAEAHAAWLTGYALDGVEPSVTERASPVRIGDAPGDDARDALLSQGIDLGGPYVFAFASAETGGASWGVELWASRRDALEHAAEIRAGLMGLRVEHELAPSGWSDEDVWHEPRFGVHAAFPWGLEALHDEQLALGGGTGAILELVRGEEVILLLMSARDPTETPEEQAGRLLGTHASWLMEREGRWVERDGALAGEACVVQRRTIPLGLGDTSVYRLERGGALYVLLVHSIGELDADEVAADLELDDRGLED